MTGNRIVAVGFFGVYAQRRAGSINLITVIRAAAAAAFIAPPRRIFLSAAVR